MAPPESKKEGARIPCLAEEGGGRGEEGGAVSAPPAALVLKNQRTGSRPFLLSFGSCWVPQSDAGGHGDGRQGPDCRYFLKWGSWDLLVD